MSNSVNQTPRNQRYQDQESTECHQCGMGFHCTDAPSMTTSVYRHFEGESFCSTNCLHHRKAGVPRTDWREQQPDEYTPSCELDEYGYPMSCYDGYYSEE